MIPVLKNNERLSQGDIYRRVPFTKVFETEKSELDYTQYTFKHAIVLSQECDLAQNHELRWGTKIKHDKWLFSVLVAPLYNSENFFAGDHLINLGQKMRVIDDSKTEGKLIKQNQIPRYHYLEFDEDVPLPNSIIDFKQFFSIDIEYLQEIRDSLFVCRLAELYRENLSQRFAAFLARIGLPSCDESKNIIKNISSDKSTIIRS